LGQKLIIHYLATFDPARPAFHPTWHRAIVTLQLCFDVSMELEDASAEQMPQVMTLARLVPMAGRHSEKSFAGNSMLSTLSAENFSMPARGGPRGNGKVFLLISTIRPHKTYRQVSKIASSPQLKL
jgi:hypothetical protein